MSRPDLPQHLPTANEAVVRRERVDVLPPPMRTAATNRAKGTP